ncbi:MAG: LysM peptidoglycan-binding domain-containing protein [Clostridia bacterium]|nr:LysM peptidoglycan-binding domain-containing protein [Clostridia bacterium]
MKFIFLDKNTELIVPVTPPSFEVSHGINVETINIHALGDVALPGYGTLATIKVNCMFPSKAYPFNKTSAMLDPYGYVEKFKDWSDNRSIIRFVISETTVNLQAIISSIIYGEKDGTGDVYATIEMREYRNLYPIQTSSTGNKTRSTEKTSVTVQTYTVKSGDTLSSICRKYYGDPSLSLKLAKHNNIKNVNLIYAGNVIKLPSKSLL